MLLAGADYTELCPQPKVIFARAYGLTGLDQFRSTEF